MARRKRLNTKDTGPENKEKKPSENNDDENTCPVKKKKPRSKKTSEANKSDVLNVASSKISVKDKYSPCNIVNYYRKYEMGLPCQRYKKPLKDAIINYCRTFQLYKIESPFDRRVTFLVWHPKNPRVLAATSHGGDLVLYNYEEDFSKALVVKGIGAGGSVQGLKFDPFNPVQIYTASMEGKFLLLNFVTKKATQFLETNDFNRWYVSLDVHSKNNVMVAGDTKGGLTILTLQGSVINTIQVHRKDSKVSHAEFSQRESWLLCTSSTDGFLKLWDIRNLKHDKSGMGKPMETITHEKPLNAAYFSLTDGCRLLTTDQKDRVNVYRAPLWHLETSIHHPHRQFQHLTPIRAYWHPLEDILFIGRYPHNEFPGYHENELRTLDFFDAETGDLLYQHSQSGVNGIMSLNRFNVTGDALVSSYGQKFMIWKPNFRHLEKLSKKQDKHDNKKGKPKGRFSDGKRNDGDDDDDDDDDGNDNGGDQIDWGAILKEKSKLKQKTKKKTN